MAPVSSRHDQVLLAGLTYCDKSSNGKLSLRTVDLADEAFAVPVELLAMTFLVAKVILGFLSWGLACSVSGAANRRHRQRKRRRKRLRR